MSSFGDSARDTTDNSTKKNGGSQNQGRQLLNNLTQQGSQQSLNDVEGRQLSDDGEGTQLSPVILVNGEIDSKVENVECSVEIEYGDRDKNGNQAGGYKWIVVLGCFFQHFITGGFERSDGVLYLKLINRFHQSAQATAWPGSLASTIRLVLGPLASAFSNRYSSRVAVIVGGIIMAVGVIISGFAPNLLFLYFSFGLVGGLGRAVSYAPGLVTVGQYFAGRPGLAVGLATSGVGAGTFVIPFLFDFLFEEYSFLGAFLILGGIPLNLCVCGALYRPIDVHKKIMKISRKKAARKKASCSAVEAEQTRPGEPETQILLVERNGSGSENAKLRTSKSQEDGKLKLQSAAALACSVTTLDGDPGVEIEYTTHVNDEKLSLCDRIIKIFKPTKSENVNGNNRPKLLELSLLKNPSFLLFCFSICLSTLAFKSAFTFLPALAKSRGCTEREAALLLSVMGAVDSVGRILSGLILDLKKIRKFRPFIYSGFMFGIASVSFVAPALWSFWSFAVLSGIYGAMTGSYVSQKSVIIVDILGVEKLSSSFGIMIFFQGIGTLIGPPLSGLLKDVFGDYTEAFYFGGGCTILAGIIMIFSNILLNLQRRKEIQAQLELKQS